MTLNEFINNLEQTAAALSEIVFNEMEEAALDAKALLQQRIQEKGTDAKGNQFPGYSEQELPLFFFKDKSKSNVLKELGIDANGKRVVKNKKGSKKINYKIFGIPQTFQEKEKAPYPNGISYKDWRVLMGLPVDHVTFTVTEEMWKKIHPQPAKIEADRIIVVIGGDDDFTKKKMGWLAERRGDFMDLNAEETEFVSNKLTTGTFTEIKTRLGQ
jgi:hypothetical protein